MHPFKATESPPLYHPKENTYWDVSWNPWKSCELYPAAEPAPDWKPENCLE